MKYFAYGSNMSLTRLRERAPSAVVIGCCTLAGHDLRFHKSGRDGSGKCNAFHSGEVGDVVYGVLFEICPSDKPALDKAEGLGYGYDEKNVTIRAVDGTIFESFTYIATDTDESLRPFSWYVNHVLVGARAASLPEEYVQRKITVVQSTDDPDIARDTQQRAMHG